MAVGSISVELNIDHEGSLEGYLREALAAGVIDFTFRARIDEKGAVRFYVHPAHESGKTVDFSLNRGLLVQTGKTGTFA